jgi:hypothetical protein
MARELTMAAKRDLTKACARDYGRASKGEKGRMLDELYASTGWSRAGAQRRGPRPMRYSYDALKAPREVWTLAEEPCGK